MNDLFGIPDDVRDLIQNARAGGRSGEVAFTALHSIHSRQVRAIARQYKHSGADRDDLIQEGFIGLSKAIQAFTSVDKWAAFAQVFISTEIRKAADKHRCYASRYSTQVEPEFRDSILFSESNPETLSLQEEKDRKAKRTVNEFKSRIKNKKEADVFQLILLDGYSTGEASKLLSIRCDYINRVLKRVAAKLVVELGLGEGVTFVTVKQEIFELLLKSRSPGMSPAGIAKVVYGDSSVGSRNAIGSLLRYMIEKGLVRVTQRGRYEAVRTASLA